MRILPFVALAACTGSLDPGGSSTSPTAATAIQVNIAYGNGSTARASAHDVWVARGLEERVAAGQVGAGGAVNLSTPPGSWDVWVASTWSEDGSDSGNRARLDCAGHANGVEVEAGATTVVTVTVRCRSVEGG